MPEKKSKLAEIKTRPTDGSVVDFINKLENERKRTDSFTLLELMSNATGENAVLWSSSIIGFGNKRYKSPSSGREVDWLRIGFAPRKGNITLYLLININEQADALKRLGKHKAGVGCVYINKLDDINLDVLKEMIEAAAKGK